MEEFSPTPFYFLYKYFPLQVLIEKKRSFGENIKERKGDKQILGSVRGDVLPLACQVEIGELIISIPHDIDINDVIYRLPRNPEKVRQISKSFPI